MVNIKLFNNIGRLEQHYIITQSLFSTLQDIFNPGE